VLPFIFEPRAPNAANAKCPSKGASRERWDATPAVQEERGEFRQRVGSSFNLKIGRVRTRRSAAVHHNQPFVLMVVR